MFCLRRRNKTLRLREKRISSQDRVSMQCIRMLRRNCRTRLRCDWFVVPFYFCVIYYYYYYYRKNRFRWHNVKRLQGLLTNAKASDKM